MQKYFTWVSGNPGEIVALKERPKSGYEYRVDFNLLADRGAVEHHIYCHTLQGASLVLERFKPIASEYRHFQVVYIGEVTE